MEPRLRDGAITPTVDVLTKGLLRTLLVLLHDFPDYLSENHFTLCNLIPPGCVQLKNLVLSAFPRQKRLPDPFMQGLRLDTITENKDPPNITVNLAFVLDTLKIRPALDKYIQSNVPADFPRRLVERIKIMPLENGVQNGVGPGKEKRGYYNVDLLNAIVLYVGMQAIEASANDEETGVLIFDARSPHMSLFTALNAELDIEGSPAPRLWLLIFRPLSLFVRDGKSTSISEQSYILLQLRDLGAVLSRRRTIQYVRTNYTGLVGENCLQSTSSSNAYRSHVN